MELLAKWNKAYNLTAVRDPEEMVSRHILDSLSIVPYVDGQNLMDVGSGPGLPGIPLVIMFPEKQFTLLDSNGKKTRFMTQARVELGLKNVRVENVRVESFRTERPFDVIMSRAFSSLAEKKEKGYFRRFCTSTLLHKQDIQPHQRQGKDITAISSAQRT